MAPPTSSSSVTSSVGVASHHVTEDTPPDFFEGCMDLLVWLPNQKRVPVSVERKMPLMDLLVHVTTSNKISPGSHVLQLTDSNGTQLPYKPSTPIGSLNAHNVYVIAKNRLNDKYSTAQQQIQQQPFEATCRVQVRLPRNQLSVIRVSPRAQLSEILVRVCQERNLDHNKYELRHPVNLDERLRLSCTLSDYRLQEVVLAVSGHGSAGSVSFNDLPATKKNGSAAAAPSAKMAASSTHHAEKKRSKGFLGFMFGRKRSSVGDSSVSSESAGDRSLSPSHSDDGPASAGISPPSPVLVSKRLIQEAAVNRNSKATGSSTKEVNSSATAAGQEFHSQGVGAAAAAAELKQAARQKKRPAPLPPAFTAGHQAAESIISSCSSSSESTAVSLPPSVVAQSPIGSDGASDISSGYHESSGSRKSAEPPVIARAKKLDQQSPRSQSVMNLASVAPKSAASSKNGRSSMSNLTQVNSTSESSISAALKKRKAPAPPPLSPPAQVAADPAAPPALAVEEVFLYLDQVLQDAIPKMDNDDDDDDSYEKVDFSPVTAAAAATAARKPDASVADVPTEIPADSEPVYAVVVKKSKSNSAADSEEKPSITTVTSVSESPILWEYKLPEPPTLLDNPSVNLRNHPDDTESESEDLEPPMEKTLEVREDGSAPSKHGVIVDNGQEDQIVQSTVFLEASLSEAVAPVAILAEQLEISAPLQVSTPRSDVYFETDDKDKQIDRFEDVEAVSGAPMSGSSQSDPAGDDKTSWGKTVLVDEQKASQPVGSSDVEDVPADSATPTDDSSGVFSDDIQCSSTSLEKEIDEHDAEDQSPLTPMESESKSSLVPLGNEFTKEIPEEQLPAAAEDLPAKCSEITPVDTIEGSALIAPQSDSSSRESEDTAQIPEEDMTSLKDELSVEPQESGAAAVTLTSGTELQQESVTEEETATAEPEKVTLVEDPALQQFGIESSTDEVVKIVVTTESDQPAVEAKTEHQPSDFSQSGPTTAGIAEKMQQTVEKKTERQRPDLMRFSISSYSQRIELDGVTYEKKLSRAESFNVGSKPKAAAAKPPAATKTEPFVAKTESFVTKRNLVLQTSDTKAQPSTESQISTKETQEMDRTGEQKAKPTDPVLSFIDQAKALLVSAPDPRAKMLEEEFLKLQQQFLAWQQQQSREVIVEQKEAEIQAEIAEATQTRSSLEEHQDRSESLDKKYGFPEDVKQEDAHPVEETREDDPPPEREEEAAQTSSRNDQPHRELRSQGPPQVTLDTWKPGRPKSEVVDLSREPCFAVPDVRSALLVPSTVIDKSPEETDKSRNHESESAYKEVPVVSSSFTRASLLTRKASIDAPRPFQLHTNQMIKRPSFQFTKPLANRAPEVRGFAHIPAPSSQTASDAPHESTPVQRLREQLIASARKPSAGTTLKLDESKKDSSSSATNPLEHPIPMPMSSSLLLAATKQIEGPPAPPPPPALPHSQPAMQNKQLVKARPVIAVDPREQLLASIKNFSSGPGLKKTGARFT